MTETHDITRPLMDAIAALPGCVCHRLHSGKVRARGGWLHLEPEGTPDLIALIGGDVGVAPVVVYLETKCLWKRPTLAQNKCHAELRRRGARVEVVRSVPEGMAVVRQVLRWRGRSEGKREAMG